ncbi:MAG: PqqD family protein [Cyanobacteria bacterium J06621_8]
MSNEVTIKRTAIYQTSPNNLYSEVADEAVILDIDSGVYYGLNSVGVDVWQWLQQPRTEAQIIDRLLAEYDVSREQANLDIRAILEEMLSAGLIKEVE